jgi:hypothetical protein
MNPYTVPQYSGGGDDRQVEQKWAKLYLVLHFNNTILNDICVSLL